MARILVLFYSRTGATLALARHVCRGIESVAGATAVQVGTANFADPLIWPKLLEGITDYLGRHQIARISDLVGTIDTRSADTARPDACS